MPEHCVSSFSAITAALIKRYPRYYTEQYTVQFQDYRRYGCFLTPQMLLRSVPHCFLLSYVCNCIFVDSSLQFAAIATNGSIVTCDELERL
jgi:hypothetical protein